MTTLVLQAVVTVLRLCFAALALATARRLPQQHGIERAAWFVAGVVFATQATIKGLQDIFGSIAFFAGPGSAWFSEFVRLSPVANHSRGLLTYCLYLALIAILVRGSAALRWKRAFFLSLAAATALGAMIGFAEGGLIAARHYTSIALSETFATIILAVILFAALFRPLLDRWLWSALAIYGLSGVFNAIYIAAFAWLDVPDSWSPEPSHLQAVRVVLAAAILVIAAWRLRLASRGTPVSGFLEEKKPSAVFHQS